MVRLFMFVCNVPVSQIGQSITLWQLGEWLEEKVLGPFVFVFLTLRSVIRLRSRRYAQSWSHSREDKRFFSSPECPVRLRDPSIQCAPTIPSIGVKGLGLEANHISSPNAEVNTDWSSTSTPAYGLHRNGLQSSSRIVKLGQEVGKNDGKGRRRVSQYLLYGARCL